MATRPKGALRRTPNSVPWIIAGLAGIALVLVLATRRGASGPTHPEPRAEAGALGESVMPASFFTENPRVVRTYQVARRLPATLDGIYCYCHCKEEFGHRSLLTCFQSQHGAGCEVCIREAEMAAEMQAQGRTLAEIRSQVDLAFGR